MTKHVHQESPLRTPVERLLLTVSRKPPYQGPTRGLEKERQKALARSRREPLTSLVIRISPHIIGSAILGV